MKFTPKDLVPLTGATIEGNEDIELKGFAKLEEAKEGDLTFLANPKYTHLIYTTGASAVLVGREFVPEKPIDAVLVRVDDPYKTLADLLNYVESLKAQPKGIEQPCYIAEGVEISEDCYVGAFAYIGAGCKIGKGVAIYPQAYVGPGSVIGDGTTIRAGVKIYEGTHIGRNCIIHSGAVIGADGFGFAPTPDGYEKIPQTGIVEIADNVEVGANTTIDRATFGRTYIGKGTKLDNLVQVAHNVEIGTDNVFAAQGGIAGSTKIGNSNMFGGQVGIAGHITIGDRNEFGAQSGIPNSIGSGRRMIGYPVVDARTFAKTAVYLRRLDELFKKKDS